MKACKRLRLLVVFLLMSATVALAQQPQRQGDKRPDYSVVVEKRYEFIVHELALDDTKAQQLKPIYMEYCHAFGKLFKRTKRMKPRDQRTDAEIEADIKDDFKRAKNMVSLREKYYAQFRTILTPRQIEKIYDIEREEQHQFRGQKKMPKDRKNK